MMPYLLLLLVPCMLLDQILINIFDFFNGRYIVGFTNIPTALIEASIIFQIFVLKINMY